VRYNFVGKGEREHYTLDHSANLYLIDAEGKLFRILPYGLPTAALVESLRSALHLRNRPDRSSAG
jgi:cytochrome oxidase Cu insertion factor (SCO1/SenC/PrrC family)